MKKNIPALNYIRAVSAIMVMLYHYTTRYMMSYLNIPADKNHLGLWYGFWAVYTFFILSGFLTVISMGSETRPKQFLEKRFFRLYPTYWTAIILTSMVTYFFNRQKFIGVIKTLINFTMLQGCIGVSHVDGAYWTLAYELLFYIVIAFVLFIKKFDKINILSLLWLIAIICLDGCQKAFNIPKIVNFLLTFALSKEYAHLFILGISLACIFKNKKDIISYVNIALCFCLQYILHEKKHGGTVFVIVIAILVYICAITNFKLKYDTVLTKLAAISYPLYLIHQNIGYVLIKNLSLAIGYKMSVAVTIIIMIFAAYIINRFIEIPIGKYLKNHTPRTKDLSKA